MSITSTELHRSRPLRSSPLAGPSVVSLEQPARAVSVHSPLGSRPASLYATSPTDAPPAPWQKHTRRPSTAPGPARPRSELSALTDDDGLSPNLHVRYSSSLLSVPSGAGTRASSILIDPEAGSLKSPRPILKHRTSFQPSSPSLSSSTSSTDDVRFSAADKGKGKMNAPASRLSNSHVHPPGKTGQSDESWYTFSPYATTPKFSRLGLASAGVVMPVSAKELARSKSSASRTKRQSGGAPSQGLSRTISSASSSTRGRNSSISTDKHGVLTSAQETRSQPQPLQQQQRQQQPQVPAPASGSASGSLPSAATWLSVPPPARTRIGKGSFKATATTTTSQPSEPSASSSRSSTRTSVSTRRTSVSVSNYNSAASSSTSLPSSPSYQQLDLPQVKKVVVEEEVKKDKRKSLRLSLGLRSWKSLRIASTSTSALDRESTGAGKEQDETMIIPLPSPPPAARFSDSPTSPTFATATAIATVSAPSIREAEAASAVSALAALSATAQIPDQSTPTSPLPATSNLISTPAPPPQHNSASSSTMASDLAQSALAPAHDKLKKRKSASAILARVKSWRWGAGSNGKGSRSGTVADGASEVEASDVQGVDVTVEGADNKPGGVYVTAADIPVPVVVVIREGPDVMDARGAADTRAEKVELNALEVEGDSQQQLQRLEDDVSTEVDTSLDPKPNLVETTTLSSPASTAVSSPSSSPAPTFTPMPTHLSTLIPSPNLHVSSYAAPGYIQSQLELQAQMELDEQLTSPSPVVLALVEAMAPALSSTDASSFTPTPNSTENLSADYDADVDGVEDSVPSCSCSSSSDSASTLVSEHHDQEELDVDARKAVMNEGQIQVFDQAPQNFISVVESSPVESIHVVVDSGPISASEMLINNVPAATDIITTSRPPLAAPTPSTPAANQSTPSSQDLASPPLSTLRDHERSRSQSRTRSLSMSRPRSGSVRRMWNAFVCAISAADAEKVAVNAWAEIQAEAGSKTAAAGELGMAGDTGRGRGSVRVVKRRGTEVDKGDAVVTVAVVPAEFDAPSTTVKAAPA